VPYTCHILGLGYEHVYTPVIPTKCRNCTRNQYHVLPSSIRFKVILISAFPPRVSKQNRGTYKHGKTQL